MKIFLQHHRMKVSCHVHSHNDQHCQETHQATIAINILAFQKKKPCDKVHQDEYILAIRPGHQLIQFPVIYTGAIESDRTEHLEELQYLGTPAHEPATAQYRKFTKLQVRHNKPTGEPPQQLCASLATEEISTDTSRIRSSITRRRRHGLDRLCYISWIDIGRGHLSTVASIRATPCCRTANIGCSASAAATALS